MTIGSIAREVKVDLMPKSEQALVGDLSSVIIVLPIKGILGEYPEDSALTFGLIEYLCQYIQETG